MVYQKNVFVFCRWDHFGGKKPRSEGDLLPDRNMEIWITCGLIKWAVKSANPYE